MKLFNITYILLATVFITITTVISCNNNPRSNQVEPTISEAEIISIQKAWSVSLSGIGNAYKNKGDYKSAAQNHVQKFYGYDMGKVLYRPAAGLEKPFRLTEEGAISYLIGGNPTFPSDTGFALEHWKNTRWENSGIINGDGNIAIAMGKCYLTNDASELVIDYTISYKKDKNGNIKIIAQKTSIPCD